WPGAPRPTSFLMPQPQIMSSSSHQYLYRIMPLRHVFDLFESRELHFASPESWDDPYERVLRHKGSKSAFAQCWCTRAVSDAMWRIYSPDRTAVRIRSTRAKLLAVGARIRATSHATFRLDEVDYRRAKDVDEGLANIASELKKRFSMKRAVDALYLKRDAFDYEAEVRAIAFLQPKKDVEPPQYLRVPVDPHRFVDSILFDPRAEETYVRMASYFLTKALRFDGPMSRSALYRAANIDIPDDVEPLLPSDV
ncbi:MAG: DUF2971 domain-containing protein, partial [Pseudomonadota bacterium]